MPKAGTRGSKSRTPMRAAIAKHPLPTEWRTGGL
jgi:hypothetical protein